jgi:hypothetical protein
MKKNSYGTPGIEGSDSDGVDMMAMGESAYKHGQTYNDYGISKN